jgi:hypothetical protein
MHGTSQDIAVSSNPSNAKVTVDGNTVGNTPLTTSLSRKDIHTVKIELDGYHPFESKIMKETSGWVWGNIIFGGLIGLAVDAITGGLYDLTPEQVQAEMREMKNQTSFIKEKDKLFITVTLNPKPEWKKIGQLEKLN